VTALEGFGLHGGRAVRVVLGRAQGELTVRGAKLSELRVVGAAFATTVASERVRVASVEHLFAALAGLGVREGVAIDVDADELPLLDGGALAWTNAISNLEPPREAEAPLVVARDAEILVGASLYAFQAKGAREVSVHFETDDPRLAREATWHGDAEDFVSRIAPARTFVMARDLADLAARGLASRVAPESAVVIAEGAIHSAGAPFAPDEPARHKLLDLIGDMYLYGGPPRGRVRACRPGHAATHAAVKRALDLGVLQRRLA
jgi:UDP-3-O-[3-hydroxymyristoyl] N-acetylglucosamine deacetylase